VGDLPAYPLSLLSTGGIHVIFVAASLRRAHWLSALVLAVLACATARADLFEYVKKEEPKYAWTVNERIKSDQGTVYDLHLVSQVWHDIAWEHQLQVYQPKDVEPNAVMLIYNTGGKANIANVAFGMTLAQKAKAPVAFLYHIPNQPLFDGKKEDALIAETFVRYLQDKDDSWPLLFPMVKSVVKAMDALQEFSKKEWDKPVKQFVITGGSKRGWTTWLTGACDPRVKAIAPLVIDTLNMQKQMDHQIECFGSYSEMIHDYTERKLVPLPEGEAPKKLWMMVDPYFYRDKLTMPKLLINGNNDPYWTTDALNLYWDGLKGDKYVCYVPNAGHDLQQKDENGKGDRTRAIDTLAAFYRHQITDKPMPKLSWKYTDGEDKKLGLKVDADSAPLAARLWVADSPTCDFRKARWKEQKVDITKQSVQCLANPPAEGCRACYAELDFEIDGIKYYLCTQVRITGEPKKTGAGKER
jgi:PhoPQ-activated pathogenicity-related protein